MLTNKNGLPALLVRALEVDHYSKGRSDYTVTQLISPPQIHWLKSQHEIQEDASDRVWSALGSAVHTFIENAADGMKDVEIEQRYYTDVIGKVIGGQSDYVYKKANGLHTIIDWKVTSAWSVLKGFKPDWEKQLNLLAYLHHMNDKEVDSVKVMAILRDWSRMKAISDQNYPQTQGVLLDIPLWPMEKQREYLKERVELFIQAEMGNPIPCTDGDRWLTETRYAVMKSNRISAVRVLDSIVERNAWCKDKGHTEGLKGIYFETRKGVAKRCEDWCEVREFCTQYG